MKDTITKLQNTYNELIETFSSIPEDKLNAIPFKESWTAAQVIEHILNAVGVGTLYAETKPSNRNPGEKIKAVSDLFLNMDIKMQSPDFIYPSDKKYAKQELLDMINDKFTKLIEAAKTLDLSPICLVFEVPGFGAFTRLEFVWFYIVHTRRHIFQLHKIAKALAG
ncbi:DinB family protein [Mucilaginibacter panaciglaebae]|uniref:DinB-like domain-containing protein n=1 Tax=Mucilaginibacter panaciglaebae TaxID=502331 RepID=A0ABP7X2C7_9SPHI